MNRSLKLRHVLGFQAYDRIEEEASSFIGATGTAFYSLKHERAQAQAAGNLFVHFNAKTVHLSVTTVSHVFPCIRTEQFLPQERPLPWKARV